VDAGAAVKNKPTSAQPCNVFSPISLARIPVNTLQGCVDKLGVAKSPLDTKLYLFYALIIYPLRINHNTEVLILPLQSGLLINLCNLWTTAFFESRAWACSIWPLQTSSYGRRPAHPW